ncbi:MAG: serine acetyltransferase [Myxococcales bacterium]|nr:serine acetyltransferase [Myxococcales bacterium]
MSATPPHSGASGRSPPGRLAPVVDALCEANRDLLRASGRPSGGRRPLPSRDAVGEIVSGLRAALFPWHFGPPDVSEEGLAYFVGRTLDAALEALERQVATGLLFACDHEGERCATCADRASLVTREFSERLPAVRDLLGGDARAAYEGDPAATSLDEAIFTYAGMTAVTYHRLAHALHELGVPLIPRIIAELAHSATGIDIHPGARIGPRFFVDHGTGVVIGETCVIGEHVRLYQGVTLGARTFPTDANGNPVKGQPRHPIIEDDVIIYAGATVLGRVTIGRGSRIAGNVWLTHGVPPGSVVSQAQAREQSYTDGGGI